jgi:hypothetical protein
MKPSSSGVCRTPSGVSAEQRPLPAPPAAVRVERGAVVGRAEGAEVGRAPHDPLERVHHRGAVTAAPLVGAHPDALDVARAQCAPAVQDPALDDRGVPDDLAALEHQRVDAAERVLPVVVVELALERVVEQHTGGAQRLGIEVGGVGRADVRHRRSLKPSCDAAKPSRP